MRHGGGNVEDGTCHPVGVGKCQGWVNGHHCGHLRANRSLGIALLLQLRDEILGEEWVIIESHFFEWKVLPGSPFHILRST